MAVDWIAVMKRGPDFTQEMAFRDEAWTAAVRATAELAGEVDSVLPLNPEEVKLLTRIRELGYAIAEDDVVHPLYVQEVNRCVHFLGHIRQQKEKHGQ